MKKYSVIDAMVDYADTSLGFSREVSCFAVPATGEVVTFTSNNSAGSVDFDWFTIKDRIWSLNTMRGINVDCAYMLHTHPMGMNRMSSTDRNMVHGWCTALGIPIWFLVITEEEIASYICSLNQGTKKIDRDFVDLSKHEDVCVDLRMMAEIMYGTSKCSSFNGYPLDNIFKDIKLSTLSFKYIHEWNRTRKWNQVIYYDHCEENGKEVCQEAVIKNKKKKKMVKRDDPTLRSTVTKRDYGLTEIHWRN